MTNEQLSELTIEQKRVKIAEACGWSFVPADGGKTRWLEQVFLNGEWKFQTSGGFGDFIPHYSEDLNAMHEVEKLLTKDDYRGYCEELRSLVIANVESVNVVPLDWAIEFFILSATAEQRANAFLKIKV